MHPAPSLSRRCVLLITIISPALMGSGFKCVAVSNPSVTTARIDRLEPTAPRVGDIMQATGSGDGTPPLQFAWDFGDGTTLVYGRQVAHVYMAPGNYRVTLTVRDDLGNTDRDSSQVAVSARVPMMTSPLLLSDAVAGQPVTFTTLPLETSTSELTYTWAFSDGQSAIGHQAAAIFPVAGIYLASVTVTDDLGATDVAQIAFQVADPAQ